MRHDLSHLSAKHLTGIGRTGLLAIIGQLGRELAAVYDNLTATQARCTELLEETRAQRRKLDEAAGVCLAMSERLHGAALPGWTCAACQAFNGEAKERLEACRCCGAKRP